MKFSGLIIAFKFMTLLLDLDLDLDFLKVLGENGST